MWTSLGFFVRILFWVLLCCLERHRQFDEFQVVHRRPLHMHNLDRKHCLGVESGMLELGPSLLHSHSQVVVCRIWKYGICWEQQIIQKFKIPFQINWLACKRTKKYGYNIETCPKPCAYHHHLSITLQKENTNFFVFDFRSFRYLCVPFNLSTFWMMWFVIH